MRLAVLSVIASSATIATLATKIFDLAPNLQAGTAAVSGLTLGALLIHAWRLTGRQIAQIPADGTRIIRLHVATHIVPAAFALATFFGNPIERVSPLWIIAFALFFYSGRRTWQALQTGFPSPIYFIFKRGNTAVLVMSVMLSVIATALQSNLLFAFVAGVLKLYVSIHFVLMGIAISKIDHDFEPRALKTIPESGPGAPQKSRRF